MTSYAAYARVSTTEQIKGYSLEAQLDACHQHGEGQDWTLYRDYIDPGHSGRSDKRPGFQAFVRDALGGHFQVGVIHKFDRFARNRAISATYKELLRHAGVRLISVTEPVDGPASIIVEGMLEVVAEWYSANLAQETIKGMSQKIRDGGWIGAPPLGYCKKDGWVEWAVEAEKMALAFKEFSTGNYTLAEWTQVAYDLGYREKSGKRIYKGRWSYIFHNKFYVGIVVWSGIEAQGKHQPLVDEETFNRVQQILAEHDGHKVRLLRRVYLLTGLLWSLDANCRMHGGVGKNIRYYRSERRSDNGQHHVRADALETQIPRVLQAITLDDNRVNDLSNDIDDALLLALKVAPTVGDVYRWLNTIEQQQALCRLVIAPKGLQISGANIVAVHARPPFCVNGLLKFELLG